VTLLVADRMHPQRNKFAMGVENEATGDSNLFKCTLLPVQSQENNMAYFTFIYLKKKNIR